MIATSRCGVIGRLDTRADNRRGVVIEIALFSSDAVIAGELLIPDEDFKNGLEILLIFPMD